MFASDLFLILLMKIPKQGKKVLFSEISMNIIRRNIIVLSLSSDYKNKQTEKVMEQLVEEKGQLQVSLNLEL